MALFGAWTRPVWHDELYTLALARLPLPDLIEALRVDSGPPLHYLICRGLFAVLGWPEGSQLGTVAVRLPSVAAFAAMPWIVWLWARRRPIVRLLGPLLTVVWLPMLYFATEARVYALLALINGVLWLLGPRLIAAGAVGLSFFAVLAAALPLLHFTGSVSLLLLAMLFFVVPTDRRRPFAFTYAAALVPLALWSPIMFAAPEHSMAWVDTMSGPGRPGVASLQVMSPAGPFPALFRGPEAPISPVASTMALMLIGVGAAAGATVLQRGSGFDRELVWTYLGLLPVAVLASASLVGLPVYFAGRSESMVWLPVVSVLAVLVGALPRSGRLLAGGPYVVIGLAVSLIWLGALPDHPRPAGVEIGHELARAATDGDVVVIAGLWQLEIEHGLAEAAITTGSELPRRLPVMTIPRSQSDHPGWLDLEAIYSPDLIEEARQLETDMSERGARIWLVYSPLLPLQDFFFPAFADWQRLPVAAHPVVAVDLLTRLPGQRS
jgi:hypothetical protein